MAFPKFNGFAKRQPAHGHFQTGKNLFRQVRLRLAIWYGGVLLVALLIFGVALYFSVQQSLLQPVLNEMKSQANGLEQAWQHQNPPSCPLKVGGKTVPNQNSQPVFQQPVPPPDGGNRFRAPFYLACYDTTGNLINTDQHDTGGGSLDNSSIFLGTTLATRALEQWNQNHQKEYTDSVDGGQQIGQLYRYALVVTDASGQNVLGVIQVGRTVEDLQSALQVLRDLLMILGLATLALASLGGLFLAGRALIPTRQAFARQQTFIADASHELRTPLTLLKADAELLMRGSDRLDPDDAELVEDMMFEADHLNNIANNLLELARLDAGKMHHEQDVVDLTGIGQNISRRIKAVATEKQLSLTENFQPSVLVIGDRQLLEQTVLILLDNAVKYTPSGGSIVVTTGLDDKQAWIEVADSGIGISQEHLNHLGERFYRVDKARSREAGGTGLGLALARGIAGMHKGTIIIDSKPDRGTTVRLALPSARAGQSMNQPKI